MSDPSGPFPDLVPQGKQMVDAFGPGAGTVAALAIAPQLMIQAAATGQDPSTLFQQVDMFGQTPTKTPAKATPAPTSTPTADATPVFTPNTPSGQTGHPQGDTQFVQPHPQGILKPAPPDGDPFASVRVPSSPPQAPDIPGLSGLVSTIASNKFGGGGGSDIWTASGTPANGGGGGGYLGGGDPNGQAASRNAKGAQVF